MSRLYRRTNFSRVPAETKERAMQLIRSGAYRVDIARACDISSNTVDKIAADIGVKLAVMKRGQRTPWRSLPVKGKSVEAINWTGVAANLRWGTRL